MKDTAIIPVIIIDYFSATRTLKCIRDFSKEIKGAQLRFVIVDNSADEDNFAKLSAGRDCTERDIRGYRCLYDVCSVFIYTGANVGFAKGNNIGFQVARVLYDFNYVLFSNNDIRLKSFDMARLAADLEAHPDVAVAGPRVAGLDGRRQSPHGYRSICRTWLTHTLYPFDRYIKGYADNLQRNAKSGYVYRVIGAFMLCDAAKFEQAGCFDEHTFLYAEELILSERLKKCGYRVYYDAGVGITHEGGYTTGRAADIIPGLKCSLESNLYYYEKYIGVPKAAVWITWGFFWFFVLKLKAVGLVKKLVKHVHRSGIDGARRHRGK